MSHVSASSFGSQKSRRSKQLTPSELHQLSEIFGVNSPLKEQLKKSRAEDPDPDVFAQFSKGSDYDKVVEGEQEFDIPARGTRGYRLMKHLAPERLARELEKQRSKKPPDEVGEDPPGGGTKNARSRKSKKTESVATRKSERLADKQREVPGAPSKGQRDEDLLSEAESNPGLQVCMSELKENREELMFWLKKLDAGKAFSTPITHADLEELQHVHEKLTDGRYSIKANLNELSRLCEGPVYQSISDEFRHTMGKSLTFWIQTLDEWIRKKLHPENPTPDRPGEIHETPDPNRRSSSEETRSRAHLHAIRGRVAPKGPLDFGESEDEEVTPKAGGMIREGDFLVDTSLRRTAKKKTPDPRIRVAGGSYAGSLTKSDRDKDVTPEESDDQPEDVTRETVQGKDTEPPREGSESRRSVGRDADGEGEEDEEVEIIDPEAVGPEPTLDELEADGTRDQENEKGEKSGSSRRSEFHGFDSELKPRGTRSIPTSERLARKKEADPPKHTAKDKETPPKKGGPATHVDVGTKSKVPPPKGPTSLAETRHSGALSETVKAHKKKLDEEARKNYEDFQRVKKAQEVRRQQQALQAASVQLFDTSPEETENVRSIIIEESCRRDWHEDDIKRLIGRFMSMGRFPAEFKDHKYIQKFLKPKMSVAGAIGKPSPMPTVKIPPLKDLPPERVVPNPPTKPTSPKTVPPKSKTTEQRIEEEIAAYGKLEEERLLYQRLEAEGVNLEGHDISSILLEKGKIISSKKLRHLFDPIIIARFYASRGEKPSSGDGSAEVSKSRRKSRSKSREAKERNKSDPAAKGSLHFSDSVVRRDEEKQSPLKGKGDSQKKDLDPDKTVPEKESVAKTTAKADSLETRAPEPSRETSTGGSRVNDETLLDKTMIIEKVKSFSVEDPQFRQFLEELLERTGPSTRESTRRPPSKERGSSDAGSAEDRPSRDYTKVKENKPSKDRESAHASHERKKEPRSAETGEPRRSKTETGSRKTSRRDSEDRDRRRPPPSRDDEDPDSDPGSSSSSSSSSSESSDSDDSDRAGFNASVSRPRGRDPYRHAHKSNLDSSYKGKVKFDPDKRLGKIPLKQPEKFTGKGKPNWEEFLNRFETYAGNKNSPENEKFQVLLDCLGGEARDLIQGFTEVSYEKGMYVKVLTILGEHYGDSRNLKSLLMGRLSACQPLKKMEYSSCTKITGILDDFDFRAQRLCGRDPRALHFFYESLDIQAERLIALLPESERSRLFRGLSKRGVEYNFKSVRDFFRLRFATIAKQRQFERNFEIETQSRSSFAREDDEDQETSEDAGVVCHTSHREFRSTPTSIRSTTESQSDSAYQSEDRRSREGSRPSTMPRSPDATETRTPCAYCEDPSHKIWVCPKFLMLSIAARYEAVASRRLCYHCLNRGHMIKDCRFFPDRACGIDGCTSKHHRLVHRPKGNVTLATIEEFLESFDQHEEQDMVEIERLYFSNQAQTFLTGNLDDTTHASLLPLETEYVSIRQVTCDLIYPGGRKRIVVALDSCANNTNIEGGLARKLNLPIQRSDIKRELNFVKGSHKFTSNYVNFQLCPTGKKGPIFSVGAYTIDDLIQDTPVPDWKHASETYPYLKEANPEPPEKDDQCLILLGTDFSGLQASSEEVKGDIDEPIAGKGPLGWWFQGRTGKFTKKGAMHYCRFQSLYVQSRAKADWEPTWLTVKRLLGKELEFNPGFQLPEISSHLVWQILAAKGIGCTEEIREALQAKKEDSDSSVTSVPEYKDEVLNILNKRFVEKPLHELRSSEPVVDRVLDSNGPRCLDELVQEESNQANDLIAEQGKDLGGVRPLGSDKNTVSPQEVATTTRSPSAENKSLDIVEIKDKRTDEPDPTGGVTSDSTWSNVTNDEAKKLLSDQIFSVSKNETCHLIVLGDLDSEPLDADWLNQEVRRELLTSIGSEAPPSPIVRVDESDPREFIANVLQEDRVHPEYDNFGLEIILTLEEDIYRAEVSRAAELGAEARLESQSAEDLILEENRKLSELLQKNWELDAVGLRERIPRTSANKEPTEANWTPAQRAIDDRMRIVHLPEKKKFQLSIPWKAGEKPNFRCNRLAVKQRQDGQARKLSPEQRTKVDEIFQGYITKGYVRLLKGPEIFDQDSRYLPYFCVIDELKETTPCRVVWDCRAVYYGKSLNSEIEDTPNRLQDLCRILWRLRKFRYTVTADVSEMFLQVLLDPKDRRYHRFIHESQDYEWKSMLFGNVSSPNASQKVFAVLCDLFGEPFPEAVETLRNSFYMDDASDSRGTEEEALRLAQELIELLKEATMLIRKFYSNSPLVLKSLPPDLLAKQVSIGEDVITVEPGKILGMKYNAGENEDYLSYQGKFKSVREWSNRSQVTVVQQGEWTKRMIAKAAASIYDPHGLISPFTVRSKTILQEIWRQSELDWDTRIPASIADSWEQWLEQVFVIQDLQIERWSHFEPGCKFQIHTFCDASEEGMCVAVYLRVQKKRSKEVVTTLLAGKARVSPLRAESISRLELVACTLGTRMSHAVREVFPSKPEDTFFWTDSMVCLHWIFVPAKAFKAYVAHRVGEVQNFTEPYQWKHVPTKENPADIGTRNVTAVELKNSKLWWEGPEFLRKPPSEWPKRSVVQVPEDPELKPSFAKSLEGTAESRRGHEEEVDAIFKTVQFETRVSVVIIHDDNTDEFRELQLNDIARDTDRHRKWNQRARRVKLESYRLDPPPDGDPDGPTFELPKRRVVLKTTSTPPGSVQFGFEKLNPDRYSVGMLWNGYRKLLRITAYVIRFIRHCMGAKRVKDKQVQALEISIARKRLIRISQRKSFQAEILTLADNGGQEPPTGLPRSSTIRKLTPFLDAQKILRSKSRIEKSSIYGYDTVYPIILNRHEGLARLIAEDTHAQLAHPVGHNAVKAKIHREYVIIGLGTLIHSIKWKCTICQRLFARPATQIEAPMPTRRLGETRLRPFTDVGIDYAGPFSIVMGRGQRRKKIYVLVMTCMATRAVHLEATGGMDTTDVLNAISRFTDIRGVPVSITSDNQTSFAKANQDLIDWLKSVDFEKIQKETRNYRDRGGIQWHFNPPQAPHFGGVFEIIVKATKRALYATIGKADLNEEDFRTAISKVTWMLNMRPIQKTGSHSDWETLTPNHFVNLPDEATFPPDLPGCRSALQARLRHQIEVQMHFWTRFQKEIIPLMAPRSKWFQRKENLKEGDLVVEIDENSRRGEWKLARIEQVLPSTDSFVRKVEIRQPDGKKFLRPISRLIPLQL